VRYTRKGTAVPCPYTLQYNLVPHLNENRYICSQQQRINFETAPCKLGKRSGDDLEQKQDPPSRVFHRARGITYMVVYKRFGIVPYDSIL
jgi:hypothetical protein